MGPRAGLDGCRKSRPPTGFRSPDRRVRSESLYRLSYLGPSQMVTLFKPLQSHFLLCPQSTYRVLQYIIAIIRVRYYISEKDLLRICLRRLYLKFLGHT